MANVIVAHRHQIPPGLALGGCLSGHRAIHEAGAMAIAKRRGRGPHRVNENRTPELLDDPAVWETIEALARFIGDDYEGDGCYGALGTACHEPSEDSSALKGMGLTPNYGWDILRAVL
jgi:hypothetical protein